MLTCASYSSCQLPFIETSIWTTRRLWTEAIYRVSRSSAVIDRGAVISYRHFDLNCRRAAVAERIGDPECNRVDTSIKVTVTFAPQLDRLAIRSNHDVVESVTVTATQIVLGLVAAHLLNDDIVDVYARIATRACAGDKVRDVEGLVLMVRWPHRRRSRAQRDDRCAVVDCQDRGLCRAAACTCSRHRNRVVSGAQ